MIDLNVVDETSPLKAVILGTAESCGPVPTIEEAYDPKSIEYIKAGWTKMLQSQLGSALYAHGAISLWEKGEAVSLAYTVSVW